MTDQIVTETLADTAAPITETTTAEQAKTDATILNGGGGPDKPVAAPADWPEDWRAKFADGDEKALKGLERYQSPKDVAKALREAQAKISKGVKAFDLPADASPEMVASWRKDNGIPEKADGYLEKLPDGLVVGEEDRPLIAAFLETMHKGNEKPATVGAALDWYYKMEAEQAAQRVEQDGKNRVDAEVELRGEWGAEYTSNQNAMLSLFDAAPTVTVGDKDVSFGKFLGSARLPDGRLLGDHPAVVRQLARIANELNPVGFVAPGGGSPAQSIATEIKAIEDFMRTNRPAYDKDQAKQARLRQLYDAEAKMASRA